MLSIGTADIYEIIEGQSLRLLWQMLKGKVNGPLLKLE